MQFQLALFTYGRFAVVKIEFEISLFYSVHDPRCDFVLNIHAANTPAQRVEQENLFIDQNVASRLIEDPATGNRWLRFSAYMGPLSIRYQAAVVIDHLLMPPEQLQEVPIADLPTSVMLYLLPSRYCQSDRLQKFAVYEFGHLPKGYSRVLAIQEWVVKRVRFSIQTTNVSTSAMDTLSDQVGVCRDFAHLMIALCRALNIPARFVTGIDYGADILLGPPDFHAYVEVYLSDRWYIIDPSGLTIPMGLIRLGTGRDAADVAFATMFGAVQSNMPLITFKAVEDVNEGYFMPVHTSHALSSDSRIYE